MTQLDNKRFYLAILAVAALSATLFYPQFSLNHDSSWYLVATRMWLNGERLYVGVIEINPPLAFYLTAPSLVLADLTGLTPTSVFFLYLIGLAFASSLWVMSLVFRTDLAGRDKAVLVLGCIAGLFVLPIQAFGQREHLMLILSGPYLFHLLLGADESKAGRLEQITMGLVATLGLALKPYFLLIPACIIIAGPVKSLLARSFTAANWSLLGGLILYLAFIIAFHAEYISQILPVATKVYGSFGWPWTAVLLRPETFAILFFVPLVWHCRGTSEGVAIRLIAAAIGALASYLIQFKGFTYQILPFSFYLMIASLWLAQGRSLVSSRDMVSGILAIAIIFLTIGTQVQLGPYRAFTIGAFRPYVERPNTPVLVLSSNVSAAFPFVNEVNAKWSSRFPAQWHIPGAIAGRSRTDCSREPQRCAEFDAILANARTAIAQDFTRYRPEVVYVDARRYKSYFEGQPFDYIAFLRQDPAFSKQWQSYAKVGEAVGYDVWSRQTL